MVVKFVIYVLYYTLNVVKCYTKTYIINFTTISWKLALSKSQTIDHADYTENFIDLDFSISYYLEMRLYFNNEKLLLYPIMEDLFIYSLRYFHIYIYTIYILTMRDYCMLCYIWTIVSWETKGCNYISFTQVD